MQCQARKSYLRVSLWKTICAQMKSGPDFLTKKVLPGIARQGFFVWVVFILI